MPVIDPHASVAATPRPPFNRCYLITKHDTNDEAIAFSSIYVGGTGHVEVVTMEGDVVLFSAVPVGTVLPIRGKRVNGTNTTASLMVGMY